MRTRCFLPSGVWPRESGETVISRGREAHHLTRVLRVRKGDIVICFDGCGREAEAVVQEITPQGTLLKMGLTRQIPASPWLISLGVAVPGQGKLDEIVNSATQLGVRRILPLLTERTIVQLTPDRFDRKQAHLQQISIEAAKQSGAGRLPEILPLTPWRQLLAAFAQYDRVLMAAVEGPHEDWRAALSQSVRRTERAIGTSYLLLIGPEGDFSSKEIRQASGAGARLVSLGPLVLRCETAVISALSILGYLLREEIA